MANWRHKEAQLSTKRALFFLFHLFLLPADTRPVRHAPRTVTNRTSALTSRVDEREKKKKREGKKNCHNLRDELSPRTFALALPARKTSVTGHVERRALSEPTKFHFAGHITPTARTHEKGTDPLGSVSRYVSAITFSRWIYFALLSSSSEDIRLDIKKIIRNEKLLLSFVLVGKSRAVGGTKTRRAAKDKIPRRL